MGKPVRGKTCVVYDQRVGEGGIGLAGIVGQETQPDSGGGRLFAQGVIGLRGVQMQQEMESRTLFGDPDP